MYHYRSSLASSCRIFLASRLVLVTILRIVTKMVRTQGGSASGAQSARIPRVTTLQLRNPRVRGFVDNIPSRSQPRHAVKKVSVSNEARSVVKKVAESKYIFVVKKDNDDDDFEISPYKLLVVLQRAVEQRQGESSYSNEEV